MAGAKAWAESTAGALIFCGDNGNGSSAMGTGDGCPREFPGGNREVTEAEGWDGVASSLIIRPLLTLVDNPLPALEEKLALLAVLINNCSSWARLRLRLLTRFACISKAIEPAT
jgi:hypothetical protein